MEKTIAPEGVVGLEKPDISILSEEFLAEERGMPQRNLAVEVLRRLLEGEIKTRLPDKTGGGRPCWSRRKCSQPSQEAA